MSWFQEREEADKERRNLDFFRAFWSLLTLPAHQYEEMKKLAADIGADLKFRYQPIMVALASLYSIDADMRMTEENELRYKEFNIVRAIFENEARRAVANIINSKSYEDLLKSEHVAESVATVRTLRKILDDTRKYRPDLN